MDWKVRWGEGTEVVTVHSLAELDGVLDRLALQYPEDRAVLAEVVAPNGDSLAIGLGRNESLLSWVQSSGDPPYYNSMGDEAESGAVSFYFGGTWSEFPRSDVVSIEVAREAVRDFFHSGGRLSDKVRWEEG